MSPKLRILELYCGLGGCAAAVGNRAEIVAAVDVGSIAAFRYQLSGLPVAVDASHATGIRDLVHPATLSGVMAGASVVLVEAHPNPLIAKSDGFQGLFPEQLRARQNQAPQQAAARGWGWGPSSR